MTGNLLYLRAAVDPSGYRWSKVDASGRARWISKSFKLNAPLALKAFEAPQPDVDEIPAGFYLSSSLTYYMRDASKTEHEPRFPIKEIGSEAPALFRELADTPITLEGIRRFANKWGLLRWHVLRNIHFEPQEIPLGSGIWVGEPAKEWAAAIYELRNYVRLWDLIRKGDAAQIPEYLRVFDARDESVNKALRPKIKESFAAWNSDDLLDFAQSELRHAVNSRLSRTLSPQLTSSSSSDGQSSADEWNLHFEPECLLDGLWFQFALAIRGQIEHRQCVVCAAWFEIATGSGRRDKRYCSVACQMRAYRKRKAGKP